MAKKKRTFEPQSPLFNDMSMEFPGFSSHEIENIKVMIHKEISNIVGQFTAQDLDNSSFLELLIHEFRALKSSFDNLGKPENKSNDLTAFQSNVTRRLEAIEKIIDDPNAMLKMSIEGFKIK